MHEASLIESALDIAVARARREGATRIRRMTLGVGALSGVDPLALEFAFGAVVAGTMAEGADLTIEPRRGECLCMRCQYSFETDDLLPACPKCGETDIAIRGGQDLHLLSLEVV